jgi:hypothetical protein
VTDTCDGTCEVASETPDAGVCHVAADAPVAVNTWPELGADAAAVATTVVAVRTPLAVRSSDSRASLPCAIVPDVEPNAGKPCAWSARASDVDEPGTLVPPTESATGTSVATLCTWSARAAVAAPPDTAAVTDT